MSIQKDKHDVESERIAGCLIWEYEVNYAK